MTVTHALRRARGALWLAALLAWVAVGCAPRSDVRFAEIKVAETPVRVEIADTPETRAKGLMHRESLPADEGMLFIYDRPQVLSFWMKNTSIPLSIAFVDSRMKIIRIADMAPFEERSHDSVAPALYALEMNQGWFRRNGVRVGDEVWIPEELRR